MIAEPQIEDASLAAAARGGDIDAFEKLLSRYESRLFSFLRQMTGNSADAEDLAQIVWVSVWRQISRFDPSRSFATWLFAIARNTAISAWRRRKATTLELQEHDWVDHAHPGESGFRREESEGVWAWVADNLNAEQRDALWLMYREEMSVRDIARTLGCSVVRVKVMLHRARKKLLKISAAQPAAGIGEFEGVV